MKTPFNPEERIAEVKKLILEQEKKLCSFFCLSELELLKGLREELKMRLSNKVIMERGAKAKFNVKEVEFRSASFDPVEVAEEKGEDYAQLLSKRDKWKRSNKTYDYESMSDKDKKELKSTLKTLHRIYTLCRYREHALELRNIKRRLIDERL